jgi:catechol 2,3-dioxygenase-like lactoylglutathione lyase family enzyme
VSEIASAIGITRLGQIAINAKDVERATAFYQDVLGAQATLQGTPGFGVF